MKVLLLGSGGREHALAWKIAASPLVERFWCAPGNAGIAQEAECVALDVADHAAVIAFCRANAVDFVVVGPDNPLVAGIVDDLEAAGIKAFGPVKAAAQLEGSKGFTKDLCREFGIPTAAYGRFDNADEAKRYIAAQGAPIVVKADGLALGKGVVVAQSVEEACEAVDMMFGGSFGAAGREIVIEECLTGQEISFFALCDGEHALPLGSAQDHKRAHDGDQGPNTGGMGAYAPVPVFSDALAQAAMDDFVMPTLRAMKARGAPFKGILYLGLMLTPQGPKLIEYNVRFGDPECQVLMLRLKSDLLPALLAARDGGLKTMDLRWSNAPSITVVMATIGYPGSYDKGSAIHGLDAAAREGVTIFHAGTALQNGEIVANGGRVLNICATAATLGEARELAYAAIDRIQWPEGFCRRDIGWRALDAPPKSAT